MPEILVNGRPIAYEKVPVHYMADGMRNYFEYGILPGSFGTALLSGDFFEICRRADGNNCRCLWEWACWLYNQAPAGSYGSQANVQAWAKRQRERAQGMYASPVPPEDRPEEGGDDPIELEEPQS
jgi:hypothetical protein